MATLASDIVDRVNTRLLAGIREPRNKLAAAVTDPTGTSISLTYALDAITAGGAVYVDLEGMYVWATATPAATVERGQFGTTATTHLNGAIVSVNPRFPKPSIFQAVNDELSDLSAPTKGLFQMRTVEVPFSASTVGYDLTGVTNIEGMYDVEARYSWLSGNWQRVPRWYVDRNANLTDFPSGFALHVMGGGQPGQNLRVIYKDKFTQLANLTDDVNTVAGFPSTANDILVLGAQMRLMTPREAKRSFLESEGDARRAEEVPPNEARSAIAPIAALRSERIASEAARLQRQYPNRRPGR